MIAVIQGVPNELTDMDVKTPIDVATRETVAFLASNLRAGAEVLEVGCGQGHVASELSKLGYRPIGVDADPELITEAQRRGVHAIVAHWPEFSSAAVDAVTFTRSLHHINPLREAVARAHALLKPTGLLLIEDSAFDEADETALHWFLEVLRSETATNLINPVSGEFATDLLSSKDPESVWHERKDHGVHSITAVGEAIAEHFKVRERRSVPYFYRYLVPVLEETSAAAHFVQEVFREETRLGERGTLVLIGRRIVGSL
jgi:SAM-dependent methyltransferase